MPVRCVLPLEYSKRDVQDIIGIWAWLKLKGKLRSWVFSSFKLCKFGDLRFVTVLK